MRPDDDDKFNADAILATCKTGQDVLKMMEAAAWKPTQLPLLNVPEQTLERIPCAVCGKDFTQDFSTQRICWTCENSHIQTSGRFDHDDD
jgi:hypothetical protein